MLSLPLDLRCARYWNAFTFHDHASVPIPLLLLLLYHYYYYYYYYYYHHHYCYHHHHHHYSRRAYRARAAANGSTGCSR